MDVHIATVYCRELELMAPVPGIEYRYYTRPKNPPYADYTRTIRGAPAEQGCILCAVNSRL